MNQGSIKLTTTGHFKETQVFTFTMKIIDFEAVSQNQPVLTATRLEMIQEDDSESGVDLSFKQNDQLEQIGQLPPIVDYRAFSSINQGNSMNGLLPEDDS